MPKTINSYRKFKRTAHEPLEKGQYVLYWMQSAHRFHYNYALDYAVAWAEKLNKPLLIYEELHCDYPWACDRFHTFYMEMMAEHLEVSRSWNSHRVHYWPHVEMERGTGDAGFYALAEQAAYVISDEFPAFFLRHRNDEVARELEKRGVGYVTIDSNGLIPLGLTKKDPYSAFVFRKIVQKNFIEAYLAPPEENPLERLAGTDAKNRIEGQHGEMKESLITAFNHVEDVAPRADRLLENIPGTILKLPIRHDIPAVSEMPGTRKAALQRLQSFISKDLLQYNELRNHPDESKTSRLSPWLHFGQISEFEIVKAALEKMPPGWSLDRIKYADGKSEGFFRGDDNIESFLNEVVTWRGVGYHYCFHREDYADFSSLPDWARKTVDEHRGDVRKHLYTYEQLENAQTHDVIWNAAQNQLRKEGLIHNYLRMLWGKKVIEWAPDPESALHWLIELNNQYALDGRDPNSYSGIFWCFGRFDRAWQEREIFGKLRYMSSDNTRKKVRLESYLRKYARA